MLISFLPSWLQDLSGASANFRLLDIVNDSVFPLMVVIPVAIVALLLARRGGATFDSGGPAEPAASGITQRAAPLPVPVQGPSSLTTPPMARPAAASVAPLVLIADDSAVVRAKLSRLLASAGFRTVEVRDGQQAFDLMQQGPIPSVLITDLEMPGMDGFELIAAVRGAIETEHVPILAITGHEDLHARVADLSGIYGIFRKPWNDRELIRRVRALATVAEVEAVHTH